MENSLTFGEYKNYLNKISEKEQGNARIIFASLLSSVTKKTFGETENDIIMLPLSPILLSDKQKTELDKKTETFCRDCVPYQYLTGECEFYGRSFFVNSDVLIPRIDTETLVEKALEIIGSQKKKVLDLCCGSGCIGLTVAAETECEVCLADFSEGAVAVTKRNAEILGVSDRCKVILHDIKKDRLDGVFDIILSNPPYIPADDVKTLSDYVKKEPETALDGGMDGLDFYRIITEKYSANLKKDGCLIFECGICQAEAVGHILETNSFYNVGTEKDGGGIDRAVWGYKK